MVRFVPGRTLVMAAAAGAAGLALGSARDGLGWILAAIGLAAAVTACVRLARGFEAPLPPRNRVVLALMLGGLLILGFALGPLGVPGLATLVALLAAAAGLEIAFFPRDAIEVSRDLPSRLALGTANEIAVRLRNRGRRALHVEVRDRAPFELLPSGQPGGKLLAAGAGAVHRYQLLPPSRAAHRFEAIDLRLTGFPGLVRRDVSIPAAAATHVYPDLKEVARYAIALHRKRERMVGIKLARKRGKGTEFESLRDYQPDDEFRDISWKASARSGKLITQTFQVERSQNVMILVEAGRMMSAQVPRDDRPHEAWLTKLDLSINAALVLAQAAALKEDRVGLLAFSEELEAFLPPKRGRTQLTAIVEALHDLQPTLCEPDYAAAFRHLKANSKRRSLVAIFTDLLDQESARLLQRALPLLAPQHLPLVIAISDPTLATLATAMPSSGAEAFAGAVAGEMREERRDILRGLRARGALVIDVAPGELSAAAVNQYLDIKARNLL